MSRCENVGDEVDDIKSVEGVTGMEGERWIGWRIGVESGF
jgi:hypothetical protein